MLQNWENNGVEEAVSHGGEDRDAWKNLTSMQFICALVVALFVTIGPFLTARFHELIVEEGGIMACFSGAFFPQRTEIVEVEE